jgi:hypothetical protein
MFCGRQFCCKIKRKNEKEVVSTHFFAEKEISKIEPIWLYGQDYDQVWISW